MVIGEIVNMSRKQGSFRLAIDMQSGGQTLFPMVVTVSEGDKRLFFNESSKHSNAPPTETSGKS